MLSDRAITLSALERLKWPQTKLLAVQSMIPAALSNLAKQVAQDPLRRNLLLTDPTSVTTNVTAPVNLSPITSFNFQTDISSLISTNQVMLDTLQSGTVWHTYAVNNFDAAATSANTVTIASHGYQTGIRVQFQGSDYAGGQGIQQITDYTDYWLIVITPNTFQIASSYANAIAGTNLTLTEVGVLWAIQVLPAWNVLQWVQSPNQGSLVSCLPFSYPIGYLVNDNIYLQNVSAGILRYAVPFVPTTSSFPDDDSLKEDLIDTLVGVALTAGVEDVPPEDTE